MQYPTSTSEASPCDSFNDVDRHREGRSPRLRRKLVSLIGRKSARHPVDLDEQIIGALPRDQVVV
jgi:hypothetical protein